MSKLFRKICSSVLALSLALTPQSAFAQNISIGAGATVSFEVDVSIDGDLTNAGTFELNATTFTLDGNWDNSGTFTAGTSSVILGGTDQTMTGDSTFFDLTKIVAAAATLTFGDGDTQTVSNTLTLQGASAVNRLALRSQTAGTRGNIHPQTLQPTIAFLDVMDNLNANATSIDARGTGSIDSGNNIRWIFDSTAGFTWIGLGADNNWTTGANWQGGVAPGAGDTAIFDGTSTKDATIDVNINVGGIDINAGYSGTITQPAGITVTVGTGNFAQDDGTFTGGDSTIDINGNFELGGGTFTSTSGTMTVSTNFTRTGGTFTHNSGTVEFDTATTTVISGSTTFNNFTSNVPGKQITFTDGTDQTIEDTITVNGVDGNLVIFRSSTPGNKWDITFPNGAQLVNYVDVMDSDANTNTITCAECMDSGNNNANWIFLDIPIITVPIDGKTVDTTPTVIGTGTAGETIEILDQGNTVIGTATIDANGNFMIETSALGAGANSLRPRTGILTGATTNITVDAAPATSVVPIITSPIDGGRISDATPDISGQGNPGDSIEIQARDNLGNLLLQTVGNGTVDGSGNFTVTVTTTLPKGVITLTVVINNVASGLVSVTLTDPFGVVFDSQTNDPIEGAFVSMFLDASNTLAVPGVDIASDDANPEFTGTDGFYNFFAANNDYYMVVEAFGYDYPTTLTDPELPAERVIVTGSRGETFTIAGVLIEMDHPMDANTDALIVRKDANKGDVKVGDIVTYTVTIENPTSNNAPNVILFDKLPPGFKFLAEKAILDGEKITDPTGTRIKGFEIGSVAPGTTKTLRYQLVVGSGVEPGTYVNSAWAGYVENGRRISNVATEQVNVLIDPLFDLGTVIGKVYVENLDPDAPRPNLGGIRIVMEDGTIITTDSNGLYNVPGLLPGRHLFRLDERTLPQGAKVATKRIVLKDIRRGLLHKVNFGITFEDQMGAQKTPQKRIRVAQNFSATNPRLHIGMWPSELKTSNHRPSGRIEFHIFTNYAAFVDRWFMDIRDADTGRIIQNFQGGRAEMERPIVWDGKDASGALVDFRNHRFEYVLEVLDQKGNEDRTYPQLIQTREIEDSKLSLFNETEEEQTEEQTKAEWLWTQENTNSIEKQSILLRGDLVSIDDLSPGQSVRIYQNERVILQKTLHEDSLISASDVLEEGREAEDIAYLDVILPAGEYTIEIVGDDVDGDGQANTLVVPADGENIAVNDDYLFFVGLGDTVVGFTDTRNYIEPVQSIDRFQDGFWVETKAAYYLEGKILGKYLITSSFDSQRDQKELFRNLDKDEYYPVYGDQSTIDYTAGDTQGKFYALVQWDRSSVKWGNFKTEFTDTEFAQFSRSLYGGKAEVISIAETPYGDPKQKIAVFQAQAQERSAHNEFLGTGGSLFYLKHTEVVFGSEVVVIEVRDQITGLVTSSYAMEEGVDYEMDYSAGRIQFRLPVTMIVEAEFTNTNQVFGGDPIYVVVDYTYDPVDKYSEGASGGRVQQAIGDHILVGGTYVEESQEQENYRLQGIDVTVKPNELTAVTIEYAESESEAVGSFVSTDGGLTFTELAVGDDASGKAYGIKGSTKISEKLGLTGYFKHIDRNFSTDSISSQQGKELYGLGGVYDVNESTRLIFRHDVQLLLDDGTASTQLQVGAQKTTTSVVELTHEMERLRLTAEWQRQGVEEKIAGAESETNKKGNAFAVSAEYDVDDQTTITVSQQVSLTGEEKNRSTIELERDLNEYVTVAGKHSAGTEGSETQVGVGVNVDVNENTTLRAEVAQKQSVSGEIESAGALGADIKVDEDSSFSTTAALTTAASGTSTSELTFAGVKKLSDDKTWTTKRTFTSAEGSTTRDVSYELTRVQAGRNLTASVTDRLEQGEESTSQTNIFGVSGDINDRWSAFMNYEKGVVQDFDLDKFDRHAISTGVGYLQRDKTTGRIKLKTSTKLEFRLDEGSENKRQYNLQQFVEGQPTEDLTLFAELEASQSLTKNSIQDIVDEEYRKIVTGFAYRPIEFDRLNLLGRYTFLENRKPIGQADEAGISSEQAHVIAAEAVFDINDRWQLTEKFAMRISEEYIEGFDWTSSQTWLSAHGLSYRLGENWRIYGEYRFLRQVQAKDYKQGVHLEVSRDINNQINIGIGYNLTDFTDDLTNLDYTAHGPFIRITGSLYDLSEEEKYAILVKREAMNAIKYIREKVDPKIARLWKAGRWTKKEAEIFYRGELIMMVEGYNDAQLKRGKTFPQEEIYLDTIEKEINRAVIRFMKYERKDRKREVKQLYQEALELYEQAKYLEAMAKFEEVRDINPTYLDTEEYLLQIYDAFRRYIIYTQESKVMRQRMLRQLITLVRLYESNFRLISVNPFRYQQVSVRREKSKTIF